MPLFHRRKGYPVFTRSLQVSTTTLLTMSFTTPLQFQVIPNLPLEDYQKLWDQAMSHIKLLLADLKRARSISDIEGYIDELDNFELLTTQEDLNGRIWQEMHPDLAFRNAAEKVYTFFNGIRAEANSSPDIAINVDLWLAEMVNSETAADSKRLMERWQKDLLRGGAYVEPSAREKVAALTKAINEEETTFLTNVRQDDRHLKLGIEELKGVFQPTTLLLTLCNLTARYTSHPSSSISWPSWFTVKSEALGNKSTECERTWQVRSMSPSFSAS
jgi:Zn-dependent oligopeptidase